MNLRSLVGILSATSVAMLMTAGCSKKEPEAASQPDANAPEAAAAPAAETAAVPATEAAVATTAAANGAGASTYRMYCVTCHGMTGKGDGVAAAALNPKPADFSVGAFRYDTNGNGTKGDVDDIKAILRDGAAKYGGSPLMAPWPMLSADQLQAVAEHVKSLHGG